MIFNFQKTIGLIGRPNSGKTTLFNTLTNSNKKTANYGGVTVASSKKKLNLKHHQKTQLIDLPGIYSLHPTSLDENITINALHDNQKIKLDLIILVLDIHNLQVSLNLVLSLSTLGIPIVVALNMVDSKSDHHKYNIPLLASLIKMPVVAVSARYKVGISQLLTLIDQSLFNPKIPASKSSSNSHYNQEAQNILKQITQYERYSSNFLISQKIDKILIHPIGGSIILLIVLLFSFQALFNFGNIPHDSLQDLVFDLQRAIVALNPHSLLINLLANGVIAGVGAIFVFLPQIVLFSIFIIIFEETGYMSRIAFLMENIMSSVGLNGRSFLPLLSSFACAIPGIISTRIIPNYRDRIITILIAPLIPCSARLPVYTLLISAFIPNKIFYGFNLQALFMCFLYIIGIIFALLGAFIIQKFFSNQVKHHSPILELPVYRLPNIKNIIKDIYGIIVNFISQAGSTIIAIMIVVWFLSSYPLPPKEVSPQYAINYSYLAMIGKFLLPIFKPIGFNWKIIVALIPGMLAREIVLAVLASVFAVETSSFWLIDGGNVHANLAYILSRDWTIATGASLITWFIFAPQCVSTLTVAKQETNSWLWPAFMFLYQFCLAYTLCFCVFQFINKFF